jgi:sugar phosphate isomerase/epimerase
MQTGLVSVSFRHLPLAEIVTLIKNAGLDGVEWGGDVHCPPTDLERVREAARLTRENGLTVFSYGSYYCAGRGDDFSGILAAAEILQTTAIRIWAGGTGSAETDAKTRTQIVADIQNIAGLAAGKGMDIVFEYHSHTLTDTFESTVALLREVGRDNVFTYWQAPAVSTVEDNLHAIRQLAAIKKLRHIHVQNAPHSEFKPLFEGRYNWIKYLAAAREANPAVMIEFVKGNEPEQFKRDAEVLKDLVKEVTECLK